MAMEVRVPRTAPVMQAHHPTVRIKLLCLNLQPSVGQEEQRLCQHSSTFWRRGITATFVRILKSLFLPGAIYADRSNIAVQHAVVFEDNRAEDRAGTIELCIAGNDWQVTVGRQGGVSSSYQSCPQKCVG